MKNFLILILYFVSSNMVMGQKRIIDREACDSWISLQQSKQSCILSNNGKYVIYQYASKAASNTIVLKSLNDTFERSYHHASSPSITEDSKNFIAKIQGDSLIILNLIKKNIQYIPNVQSYTLPKQGNGKWLVYRKKGKTKTISLKNLVNNKEKDFNDTESSMFDQGGIFNDQGTVLLIRTTTGLRWIDLLTGNENLIPKSNNISVISFNKTGDHIAFIQKYANENLLKHYKPQMGSSRAIASNNSRDIRERFQISERDISFSKDGKRIFFQVKQKDNEALRTKNNDIVTKDVNVWTYKDIVLQPKQLVQLANKSKKFSFNADYKAVVEIETGSILLLETENIKLISNSLGNNYALLSTEVSEDEFYWNNEIEEVYLISLKNGEKRRLTSGPYPNVNTIMLSPDETNVLWFDGALHHYFLHNIETNTTINVSKDIRDELSNYNQRGMAAKAIHSHFPAANYVWLDQKNTVLIHSRYDIWQLDLSGKKKAINLTNNYGKKHNIRFRLLGDDALTFRLKKDGLLLWAFNDTNKQNGFWKITQNEKKDPIKLIMDNHAYYFVPISAANVGSTGEPNAFVPIKAKNDDVYIIRKMSATEPPNLFFTNDFTLLSPISNLEPQKTYNWLTAELITWTLPDGSTCDGILHKPENIDSSKKYPVIFTYYERHSEHLNDFRYPELTSAAINIPWFVSRGYLVFEPDFYYTKGKTAMSVINSIEGSVKKLSSIPYIDTSRMGLQGQSHGGYETNVIIAGTNIFKAACEMAGYSNIISEYGSIRPGGMNNQIASDLLQRNLGVAPWQQPDVFIENSPVFHIGRITTPLLIVHNRNDGAVNFSQAIEMYLGMRRERKKVWMLEYDKEPHQLLKEENKLDYTIRLQQFFDYYLKHTAPPVWMTRGIHAKDKGTISGLLLDSTDAIP